MKYLINTAAVLVLSAIIFPCCHPATTDTRVTNIDSADNSVVVHPQLDAVDSLIKGRFNSKAGDELQYTFNNNTHTMTIRWKDQTALLQQDTTASGIQYSNREYRYYEWHSVSTLQKNGKTVFESNPKEVE